MNEDRGPLRDVSWRDLCPWLIIFRVYRPAVRLPALTLATIAVLLTPVGWRIAQRVFLPEDSPAIGALYGYGGGVGIGHRWPTRIDGTPAAADLGNLGVAKQAWMQAAGEIASVYHGLLEPFRQLFDFRWTLGEFAFFLVGALWTLAVWAFFGGAITRMAIVPLACERHVGLGAALRHAARKFPAYFLAPLFPLLGAVIGAVFLSLIGLVLRMGDAGMLIAGVLWFLVILGGFAMAYILVGLVFGWPLMWAAASAERDPDFFDSVSRAYSYTRQAPLKFLFYALVAALFGGLCWLLVAMFAEAVIALGEWGVSWGAGRERMLSVYDQVAAFEAGGSPETSGAARAGAGLIAAWTALVRATAIGFAFSFFWCAVSAIYLLLRFDVDRREMDEIWFEENRPAQPQHLAAAAGAQPGDPSEVDD